MNAYRGILVDRAPRRWHPIVSMNWPPEHAHREWLRRAAHETGLGAGGRGYTTRRELYAAIDRAIATCGEPPATPTIDDL